MAGAVIGAAASTGFQLYSNGGDWHKVDIQQVGLAAAAGFLNGGLGTITAELGVGVNIALNTAGSGVISGAQQMASNALHGDKLTCGVGSSALKGAAFAFVGAGTGAAINAVSQKIAQNAFDQLLLADKLWASSNAISGPYFPAGMPNWAIGGNVTGNAVSNLISNLNQ